jgi:PatG C-terminal
MTEQGREDTEQQEEVIEQAEGAQRPEMRPAETADEPAAPSPALPIPEVEEGANPHPYVYAIGTVEPRFPTLAAEKEFAQTIGRAEGTAGLTDREALRSVLSERANRYLLRQLCFVMTIQGLETYILRPRDPADFDLLVEALRSAPRPTDVDVVVGLRGPIAPPEVCNGLMVPVVGFDQLYSFDVDSFIEGIPRPEDTPEDQEERFRAAAEELYYTIVQLADNAGATDEHRALNYLTVRYDRIYAKTAEMFERNASLSRVEVRPSRLSSTRRIVDVIFTYTYRETDVDEKHFVRVDVTEPFPFLVTKMSPYYDR